MTDKIVVLVTCGSEHEAARLAHALVEERLAACVNVHASPVRSVYRWKGKVEQADERLLMIKTTQERLGALTLRITELHAYEVPEVLVLSVEDGADRYLDWLAENARATG